MEKAIGISAAIVLREYQSGVGTNKKGDYLAAFFM